MSLLYLKASALASRHFKSTLLHGVTASSPSTLTNDLESYYDLDEASGDAVDSHGSNDLADNNTVGSVTDGVVVREFERSNSEFFSIADNASLSAGDIGFTICGWVKLQSKSATGALIAKDSGGAGEYALLYNSSIDKFIFEVFGSGGFGSAGSATDLVFGSPSLNTWYFVAARHDPVANTVSIRVDNNADTVVSHSAGIFDGGGTFRLGNNSFSDFIDGRMKYVGIWKRVLTDDELDELYNGGTGLSYADLSSGGGDVDLSGNITSVSALAGSLSSSVPLSSTIAASSALAGILAGEVPLSGTVSSQSTLDGITVASVPISGTIVGQSTVVGAATSTVPLSGTITSSSSISGNPSSVVPLSGNVSSASVLAGELAALVSLSGSINGTSTLLSAQNSAVPVSGSISGTSSVSGIISSVVPLSGTVSTQSGVVGSLSSILPLSGEIAGDTDIAGTLSANVSLAGTTSGVSSVIGTLSSVVPLGGTIAATSTVAGTFQQIMLLTGTLSVTSSLAGTITTTIPLSGTVPAQTSLVGTIGLAVSLGGTIATHAAFSAQIGALAPLSGTVIVVSSLVGSVLLDRGIIRVADFGVLRTATGKAATLNRNTVSFDSNSSDIDVTLRVRRTRSTLSVTRSVS